MLGAKIWVKVLPVGRPPPTDPADLTFVTFDTKVPYTLDFDGCVVLDVGEEIAMAKDYRIFISFAVEDKWARDFLVGQAKNDASPFSFVDMSVKEPWSEQWKTNCRTKIRGCDGMIAMVSKSTAKAAGALWEVACAKEEGVPVRGVYVSDDDRPSTLRSEFNGVRVVNWTWNNIKNWLDSL